MIPDRLKFSTLCETRQKLGGRITQETGASTVNDISGFTEASLAASFGQAAASFLVSLPTGGPWEVVKERGPPKTVTCERSFPAATTQEAVRRCLEPLADELSLRVTQVITLAPASLV